MYYGQISNPVFYIVETLNRFNELKILLFSLTSNLKALVASLCLARHYFPQLSDETRKRSGIIFGDQAIDTSFARLLEPTEYICRDHSPQTSVDRHSSLAARRAATVFPSINRRCSKCLIRISAGESPIQAR